MHPIIARRERLIPFMLAWMGVGVLLATHLQASPRLGWGESLILALPWTAVYGFFSLSAWHICRTFPLSGSGTTLRLLGAQVAAALFSSALWIFLGRAWSLLLARDQRLQEIPESYDSQVPLFFGIGVLLYLLAVAVHYLIIAFERSQEAEKRGLELKVLAREAELRNLKMQIDPHFLFNSLNSISALIGSDAARARGMCLRLSEFLRGSLALADRDRIPFSEELALVRSFLAIEQVRFGSRLQVDISADDGVEICLIPPLLLQPLIENAVKHGIGSLLDGGTIVIRASRSEDRFRVTVENPYEPEARRPRSAGVGLENVRRRLAALYGPEGRIEVTRESGRYSVALTLPAPQQEATDAGKRG